MSRANDEVQALDEGLVLFADAYRAARAFRHELGEALLRGVGPAARRLGLRVGELSAGKNQPKDEFYIYVTGPLRGAPACLRHSKVVFGAGWQRPGLGLDSSTPYAYVALTHGGRSSQKKVARRALRCLEGLDESEYLVTSRSALTEVCFAPGASREYVKSVRELLAALEKLARAMAPALRRL